VGLGALERHQPLIRLNEWADFTDKSDYDDELRAAVAE
jgi:hypothetical protein